jgi:putative transposase
VEADRKREEEERRLKRAIEEILLEHPEYGYRRVTEELHRKGIPVNHKRVHRLLQDFHLSLKRTARRPKPNPLLGIVLLAGDKADLRALLLKQREPEPFDKKSFRSLPSSKSTRLAKRLSEGPRL